MITKEQLVCTKEQAMILKAKGITQKSLFAWTEHKDAFGYLNLLDDNIGEGFAAFTTAELMEILPKMNRLQKMMFFLKTNLEPPKVAAHLFNSLV